MTQSQLCRTLGPLARPFLFLAALLLAFAGPTPGAVVPARARAVEDDRPAASESVALEDGLAEKGAAAAVNAQSLGASYVWVTGTDGVSREYVRFRVFSSRATRIEVWIYKNSYGYQETVKYVLTKNSTTDQNSANYCVWSKDVLVSTLVNTYGITGPVYYGYRAWGPNWPYNSTWTKGSAVGFVSDVDSQGNRFNPNKLLLDPYAKEVTHDRTTASNTDGTIYASGPDHRIKDSGAKAPKGIALRSDTTSIGTKPTRALKDDVIYEVHVRGLTKNDTSIPSAERGTYKAAGAKAAYIKSLGVTAVEFLPLHESQNDANDVDPASASGDNYWGYATDNFFAPDRRYSYDKTAGGPTREFKAMVKAFHDQGIKVFVDVVYNHTGEGYLWSGNVNVANVQSFRGLDNPTYYSLTSDMQYYYDNTGTGGNYNTKNKWAQNLIVDSLAYWKDALGVDGFRFDLASVLGNECEHGCFSFDHDKSDPNTAMARIPIDIPARPAAGGTGCDLIAEPWAASGSFHYQVGNFPSAYAEWNDKFRDRFREDQNQMGVVSVTLGELATRFTGSSDLYSDDGRKPYHSINFIVAHDGFTLKDLYSYNSKVNDQPWPYGPSDGGSDNNRSWDQAGVATDQRKAARNGMAFLAVSAGTPMMVGGDEYLRSTNGNNNPYNVDSSANWLSWSWTTDQTNFKTFTSRLLAFRNAHPALRPLNFYSSYDNNGNVMEQHRWFVPSPANTVPDSTYWNNPNNHAIAFRVDGTEFGDTASAIYVAYNGWSSPVDFRLPWPGSGKSWYRVTDTATWAEGANQVRSPGSEDFIGGENTLYSLHGRAVLILIAK